MFDIGFSEILLIFVVALVVLGPEKLPRVAAQVGRWIGRARGMARQFREQLEQEVSIEESRKTQPPRPPDPSSIAPPVSSPAATTGNPVPASPPDAPVAYPDAHSQDAHSHSLPAAQSEGAPAEPSQHDWVGGVTNPELPTQRTVENIQGDSHERGA